MKRNRGESKSVMAGCQANINRVQPHYTHERQCGTVRRRSVKALCLCLLISFGISAEPGDYEREAAVASEIATRTIPNEAVWLNAGGRRFLGLYREPSKSIRGAVLIVPEPGLHPNWPNLIRPLRIRLAEMGWATLGIQLPLLESGASLDEYDELEAEGFARVSAAAGYLSEKKLPGLAIAGHGRGCAALSRYLAEEKNLAFNAAILLSCSAPTNEAAYSAWLANLSRVAIPLFESYVKPQAANEKSDSGYASVGQKRTPKYRGLVFQVDDRWLRSNFEMLLSGLNGWLSATMPKPIDSSAPPPV